MATTNDESGPEAPTEEIKDIPDDTPVVDVDGEAPDEEAPTERQVLRYYGVDFDVEGIQRRFDRGDLIVPSFDPAPDDNSEYDGFQRRFVWSKKQMDRFVESLLLGYPVPGIFLVEEASRRFLILDGQQRIKTLHAFYSGIFSYGGKEKIFKLENVTSRLRGFTYKNLPEPDRRLLDSTILQATVVVPTSKDRESVYRVFERINSGGIKLQPQEIRVALYMGDLIKLIRSLNANENWRELFGPPHTRLKDQELILRYLALLEYATALDEFSWDRTVTSREAGDMAYKPAMTTYLNSYLNRHRNLDGLDAEAIRCEFETIAAILAHAAGKDALRLASTQVNAALSDAIMVGAAFALRKGSAITPESAANSIDALRKSSVFRGAVLDSTSHAENVYARLKTAYEQFVEDAAQ